MASDFSARGRSARERIPVPAIPLDSIRRRSHAARARGRAALFTASAVIALGAAGAGTGVAAKISHGVQVWLSGGETTFAAHSGVIMRYPMASELRSAVAGATFPVVFPLGLPAGSRVQMVTSAPLGHPSVITVSYENGNTGFKTAIALIDPAVVETDKASLPTGTTLPPLRAAYHFRAGSEIVLALEKNLSRGDLNRIKAATVDATPQQSLAATEAMLPRMTVLGGTVRLQIAERYRPAAGRSVLVDDAYFAMIPGLAKATQPLLDRRIIRLSSITYAKGDIAKATGIPSTGVAISAAGVRALDAVLRSTGEAHDPARCGCEMLLNQPDSGTYRVWAIPFAPAAPVRAYAVDARTFTVSPVPQPESAQ